MFVRTPRFATAHAGGVRGAVSFLNEYFSLMVECIANEGGMLDKFIGDAIMACFGLPMPHDDDPDRAVRAAIAMIARLWEWNAERRATGSRPSTWAIGINTEIGRVGQHRLAEADGLHGDRRRGEPCLAAGERLQAVLRPHPHQRDDGERLSGTYRMRDIDLVVVKGKTKPVRVYEVLDYHTRETFPNLMDVVNYFNEGIGHYRAANWEKASIDSPGASSFIRAMRCRRRISSAASILAANPPAGDWNGVWVMTEK